MSSEGNKITLEIPGEIYNFIQALVEKGLFKDIEDFVLHSIRLLSEFYGLPGESILRKVLAALAPVQPTTKVGLGEKEQIILDAFGKSRFVYQDELYMLVRKEAVVRGSQPMSREEFEEALENLIREGMLEKIQHGNDVLIRKKEE